jgi:hypothetical protein
MNLYVYLGFSAWQAFTKLGPGAEAKASPSWAEKVGDMARWGYFSDSWGYNY